MSPDTATTPPPDATPPNPAPDGPWHSRIFTPEGAFAPKWQDALPDEFADDRAMLAQFGDFKTMTKALRDNMTAARAKTDGMVKVPGAEATDEERAAFFAALGRPEKPEGYGLTKPEKLPDGVEWDEGMSGKFAEVAHKIGLTPAQAAALRDFQLSYVGEQAAASRNATLAAMEAEKAELKKTFGDGIGKAVESAQRLAQTNGFNPEIFDPQSANFWGVEALAFASKMAGQLGEGKLLPGAAVTNMSPAMLAQDIMTNPENPDYKRYQAHDPATVARVTELMKRAS